MSLGTKNRQIRTAQLCKEHLRSKFADRATLVEEYISEVEGIGKDRDITKWGTFTDIKNLTNDTLTRVEQEFRSWLNPSSRR
jgi:hypothetical protein